MNRFKILILALMAIPLAVSVRPESVTLEIYCEEDPPFQFESKSGKLEGFGIEVVREIQSRTGGADPIKLVPWARGYEFLKKKPNVLLFSILRTAERDPLFQWIGPYFDSSFGLYAKKDSPIVITNLDDAKKVRSIGIYCNDVLDQQLTSEKFTNLYRVMDNVANIKQILIGRVDLVACGSNSLDSTLKEAGGTPDDLKLVYTLRKGQIYIAASRGTPESIVKRWNAALESMKQDGWLKKTIGKYYPGRDLPGPAITTF